MRLPAVLVMTSLMAPACATVPRRSEVASLASRILDCPPQAITVRAGAIDQICTERIATEDVTRTGPCVAWMPLTDGAGPQGWIVEGCGHVDRYAEPPCGDGIWPAEIALSGWWDCPTY